MEIPGQDCGLCVEVIIICALVIMIGWNKGVKEWFEQFEQPVLKEVDISGINSPNAILMQARGGKILGEINGEAQIYPASMTKIMTVILGIENFDDLDEKITLTNEMFTGLYEQDATQAGFQPGEEVRVIDLLYGAMLPSGAECCIALADTISGSEADFAELMNKKARKLGMENTHFCDSTGLHNPDHYSTPDILPELQISTRMELLTTVQCLKICLIRQSQVEKSSVARPAIPVRQGTVW